MDAAFGGFLDFLKRRGLYEKSIVILTSDHGDSLGEEGRWGHAYTLYPEVVRIPLVVHLPPDLRATVKCDPDVVALTTDITPSLYYLLGHRPLRRHPLFGMPLFTVTPQERARDPHAAYLLASSYGAVYGILDNNGRRLDVADGVNYRSYEFELGALGAVSRSVGESFRRSQDESIRSAILAINLFYRFGQQDRVNP
jgi:arylsulfatase A-like enzyme